MRSKLLALLSLIILLSAQACTAQVNSNSMAVGKFAKTKGDIDISINPVVDFKWKTREEILNMRKKELFKYPQLLLNTYTPYPPIWSAVEDGKPWWGTTGSCLWGSGPRSIEGPSEESRYVLNPYMLVGVNPATLGMWIPAGLNKADIEKPDFPYFWYPESIKINAEKCYGTATFNITKFLTDIRKIGSLVRPDHTPTQFSLVAYNARDLGYNYIWLNEGRSINVTNDNKYSEPIAIPHMIHCGGSCGYEGGCNNMSPATKELDRCRLQAIPARACIYLWKDNPPTVDTKPDFIFLLEFK